MPDIEPTIAKQNASASRWRLRVRSSWSWLMLLVIGFICLAPLMPLLLSWFDVDAQLWSHLWQTQLPELMVNTLTLSVLVALMTFALGTGLAWLMVMYRFKGQTILHWGLMLPLAIPPYILAFVLLGFTDFQGPLHELLQALGLGIQWLPDIRHSFGVAVVFSLSLYPYVYLLMRSALQRKGRSSYESARTLGYSKLGAFWRLVVPMTRPAWVAGLALVLMETLADFGAVSIFNYDTFTTAIYKSWFGFFSVNTAAQLACVLLLFVALALMSERWGRGNSAFHQSGTSLKSYPRSIKGVWGMLAVIGAWLVFAVGFILPVAQLVAWAYSTFSESAQSNWALLGHTVTLAAIGAMLCLVVAGILVGIQRLNEHKKSRNKKHSLSKGASTFAVEASLMGYALPGTVLAVGIMLCLNWFDTQIAVLTGINGQWLAAGIFALLLAYVIRFLRIAHGPLSSSMGQIKPSIIEAAGSLGANKKERLLRVYIPLLRPGVMSALLLVFVEIMKEMPATLLLRPFGWDTLAVRIYELTSEGEWERAALPAAMLIIAGVIPVIYLIKKSDS